MTAEALSALFAPAHRSASRRHPALNARIDELLARRESLA